jgi:5-methylcytosine-specific restriction endonuclease McrA
MAYKDPERQRAYGRDWIKRNPEKARAAMRRWRAAHPEKRDANNRVYYRRHREQVLAQSAQYHRDHPEVGRARWQNYRARKRAAEGSFTATEWLALVELYGGRCAYRGEEGPLEVDHRIPLARGGSNRIENILPACRGCNAEKHDLTEEEFRNRLASEKQRDDLQSA